MTDWAATKRLAVRVMLAEGLSVQGDIHLQSRVAAHEGPETPLELLNRGDAFLPLSVAQGKVVFLSKSQMVALTWRQGGNFDDPVRKSAARAIGMEVMMVGGSEYRGTAVSELPPTRGRALDFLNEPEQFFQLSTDEGTVCLNRRFVRAVRPMPA
jgi:hypothetical protein